MSFGSAMKRTGWMMLAVLFIATGLGIGIYGFWQYTHPPEENTPEQSANSETNSSDTNQTKPPQLKGTTLEGFTPVAKVEKLTITNKKVGTGTEATKSSTVTAHYTGALAATGTIFESSLDDSGKPFTSPLSGLIKGWQQGIPGMKAGGERRLLIPAALAYGDNPPPGIPPNADLVFDIVLIAVK